MSTIPSTPLLPLEPTGSLTPAMRELADGQGGPTAEKAGKDFEAVLLYKLLEEMQRTVPESGLLDGGEFGGQIRSIFWQYLADDVAAKGGIGLWKELSRQLGEHPTTSTMESRG